MVRNSRIWRRRDFIRGSSLLASVTLYNGLRPRVAFGVQDPAMTGAAITGFGYKMAWLAVKGDVAAPLIAALRSRDLGPIDWNTGLKRAYEVDEADLTSYGQYAFITRPLDGWTLCVGFRFFSHFDARPPTFDDLVVRLSRELDTDVQYFATHRVAEGHAWAMARQGRLVRAYAYFGDLGETLVDEGAPTSEETALGFAFFDARSPDAGNENYWDRTDLTFPNESHIMALAGAWSLDPTMLDGRLMPSPEGRLAEF